MKDAEINYHVARLFSPIHLYKVGGVNVYLKQPKPFYKYLAEIVWRDTYESAIESFNEASIVLYLVDTGTWTVKKEDELNHHKEQLDNAKVKLFENRYNDRTVELVRQKITEIESTLANLLGQKHCYDYLTAEHVADQARERFLVGCSLYVEGKKHWGNPLKNYSQPDELTEQVMSMREFLTENQVRKIARSNQFAVQKLSKPRPPEWASSDLKEVFQWSGMYESIRKHPDCPEDFVFDNDDMLDGWVILQRKKNEKARIDKKANDIAARHKNAGEIFVVAGNDINAEQIEKMNSRESLMKIRERSKYIQEKGSAVESELPDVQREIQMAMNRAAHGQR